MDSGAQVPWLDLKDPDTNIAGAATKWYGLDCIIDSGTLWINSTHINATPHNGDTRQCITIHEYGHVMNLRDVLSGTTIMRQPHSTRCHSLNIHHMQVQDVSDINHIY